MARDEVDRMLQPFTGTERTLADVQRARAALEAAYARLGYGATQIALPEQEIKDGVVQLRVIEGRLTGATIEGNRYFDAPNVRRSLPALVDGEPLNTARLARELRLANESRRVRDEPEPAVRLRVPDSTRGAAVERHQPCKLQPRVGVLTRGGEGRSEGSDWPESGLPNGEIVIVSPGRAEGPICYHSIV
jgi:hypothetical protein